MYHKAYGIIETLAPLHVGASAGEETGNLNLIFRDQFTQTGIIPGSSIRGRFRADMRSRFGKALTNIWYGHDSKAEADEDSINSENLAEINNLAQPLEKTKDRTTESLVKFEYASLVWLPVFCPGQPIVWVTCPRWLRRYAQITGTNPQDCSLESIREFLRKSETEPLKYPEHPVKLNQHRDRLFFNLGFLDNLQAQPHLSDWVPQGIKVEPDNLVVVTDDEISLIHDMALYRQTRTKLNDDVKKVENFFGFEALPEDSILIFPIAIKKVLPLKAQTELASLNQAPYWVPFDSDRPEDEELYFGGLESIGCGRCKVTVQGNYFVQSED